MRLSPMPGLEELRPLGSINRLRSTVFDMSREKGEKVNAMEGQYIQSVDEVPQRSSLTIGG